MADCMQFLSKNRLKTIPTWKPSQRMSNFWTIQFFLNRIRTKFWFSCTSLLGMCIKLVVLLRIDAVIVIITVIAQWVVSCIANDTLVCFRQIGDGRSQWQREARVARRMWARDGDGSCERSAGSHNQPHLFFWPHAEPRDWGDAGLQVAACWTAGDTFPTLQPPSQCPGILLCWSEQLLYQFSERGKRCLQWLSIFKIQCYIIVPPPIGKGAISVAFVHPFVCPFIRLSIRPSCT